MRQAPAAPLRKGNDLTTQVQRRGAAAEALSKIESGGYGSQPAFWSLPYGEPPWLEIPAGKFWMGTPPQQAKRLMGSDSARETPQHIVYLERYWMAKTPITKAQYRLFVEATGRKAPVHWENGKLPRGLESHPVVQVTWHDALAYCQWLGEVTRNLITLPSEAEWEKAARGDKDKREYPWGMNWREGYCNSSELSVGSTTPVGIFLEGVSLYGCLDMVGNVWESTRSHFKSYPYDSRDGREKLEAGDNIPRVLRGGSFHNFQSASRCSYRCGNSPYSRFRDVGFQVCVVSRQE